MASICLETSPPPPVFCSSRTNSARQMQMSSGDQIAPRPGPTCTSRQSSVTSGMAYTFHTLQSVHDERKRWDDCAPQKKRERGGCNSLYLVVYGNAHGKKSKVRVRIQNFPLHSRIASPGWGERPRIAQDGCIDLHLVLPVTKRRHCLP